MSSHATSIAFASTLSIALVTTVVFGGLVAAPTSAAPVFSFMCLTFVAVAIFGGRVPTAISVAIGTLELAFVLPGQGFAVSDPDHALGLIATIATGLLLAWYVGRVNTLAAIHEADVKISRQVADWRKVAHTELSHRLSNDLSIMISMASIKARQAKTQEARDALHDLSGRLVVLGRVYRRLDVRDQDRDDAVGARSFLYDLCDDLQLSTLSAEAIALHLDVDNTLRLPIRTLSMIGLITNELMTNVRKHAYPDGKGGQVTLYFHRHAFRKECLELIVSDNGNGFTSDAIGHQGVGRNLLGVLASQIGGTIAYSRIAGTTVATLQFVAPSTTLHDANMPTHDADSVMAEADVERIIPSADR